MDELYSFAYCLSTDKLLKRDTLNANYSALMNEAHEWIAHWEDEKNKKKRVTWSNQKKTSIELVGIIERVNCEHGRSLRNV